MQSLSVVGKSRKRTAEVRIKTAARKRLFCESDDAKMGFLFPVLLYNIRKELHHSHIVVCLCLWHEFIHQ
jgi:hypothetical protein